MRIVYVLEGSGLFGGTKVVLLQAELLRQRGYQVTVVSREPAPDWIDLGVDFLHDPQLDPRRFPEADFVVATYWTTIPVILSAASGRPVHFCQGLEYLYTHNRDDHPAILAAYGAPVPALCVAPHLVEELRRRFQRSGRVVRQPLESYMRPVPRQGPGVPPRILIVGPFEVDWKGVKTCLEAVRSLRRDGLSFRLIRLSQWPFPDAERGLITADEYHSRLAPKAVAGLIAGCDLLLSGSGDQEGFGLPVLEAMACGVPVVATDIAPYRWFAALASKLVPRGDAGAMASAVRHVLGDERSWRSLREAGLSVARDFAPDRVSADAAAAFEWVAGVGRVEPVEPPACP